MTDWIEIGQISDIPVRGARCVKTPFGRIALFRTHDDQIFAADDHCPHKAGPLSEGIVHDTSVTCPMHNMVFSLKTGEAHAPDKGQVRTYPVKMQGTRIFMQIPEVTREAAE